jgi:trehalose/maltose transport system substrate-binding protein
MAPLIANDTVDGRLVALPWFLDLGLLYYRKDLLDAAGIRVPTTWPALEDAATRLQDPERGGGNPRFWGFLWQGRPAESLTCNALEWIASWRGGAIVAPSGRVTVDNPRAAYALERASRWLGLISPSSVLADSEAQTLAQFAGGNAAFMRHWPYVWQTLNAADAPLRGRVGVAPLPRGGLQGEHAATIGGWQLAVPASSRNPRLAADLIRYLVSAEVQRERAVTAGYIPSRPALLKDPAVLAATPYMATAADKRLTLVARPATVTGVWYPEVSARVQRAVFAVLAGREDADAALAALARGLNLLSQRGTNWSAHALAAPEPDNAEPR